MSGAAGGIAVSGGAAAAAAIIQAVKASGVVVRVEPEAFLALLRRQDKPLVVTSAATFFQRKHQYLTPYRGLAFHTKSAEPLSLPGGCEIIRSARIWVPG